MRLKHVLCAATALALFSWAVNVAAADKPNILVIWGDAVSNQMKGGSQSSVVYT